MKKYLLLILFVLPLMAFAYPGQVLTSFNAPAKFSTGMTFDGQNLWIADRKTDLLYCVNPSTGKIVKTLKAPAYWITGLTWDGKNLWAVDMKGGIPKAENYQAMLYKINPENGIVEQTVEVPIKLPQGLAFDGKYIWIADDYANEIVQIDQNDGTTIKTLPAPDGKTTGLCFDGEYLWNADHAQNKLYMIEPNSGAVIVYTDSPNEFPRGLAFDGENIWNIDSQTDKIYKLVRKDEELFHQKDAKNIEVTYTHLTTNFGPGKLKTLDVHLAIPSDRTNQMINNISYSSDYTDIVTDKWGQKTAHFQTKNISSGNKNEVSITIRATLYDVTYYIYPDKVGDLKDLPADTKKFLTDDAKYDYENPVIQNALKQAIGEEKNPYWIARKIFDYIHENMYYEMSGGWNTAPTVLARGNGSCSEYSFVYISMCRAAGIPARYVGSIVIRGEDASSDDVFHRWVEVYLPNYGWVPVDPSGGDQKTTSAQARYFGHLAPRFMITTQSGGGSETMGWTYNSNYFYTTEPQTNVVIEYFGDWKPVLKEK